jgi:hypothetical protein
MTVIDMRDGGTPSAGAQAASSGGGTAAIQAGSETGGGQRAAIFPTVKWSRTSGPAVGAVVRVEGEDACADRVLGGRMHAEKRRQQQSYGEAGRHRLHRWRLGGNNVRGLGMRWLSGSGG